MPFIRPPTHPQPQERSSTTWGRLQVTRHHHHSIKTVLWSSTTVAEQTTSNLNQKICAQFLLPNSENSRQLDWDQAQKIPQQLRYFLSLVPARSSTFFWVWEKEPCTNFLIQIWSCCTKIIISKQNQDHYLTCNFSHTTKPSAGSYHHIVRSVFPPSVEVQHSFCSFWSPICRSRNHSLKRSQVPLWRRS